MGGAFDFCRPHRAQWCPRVHNSPVQYLDSFSSSDIHRLSDNISYSEFEKSNIAGTTALIKLASEKKLKRFSFVSSMSSAFGELDKEKKADVNVHGDTLPLSNYGFDTNQHLFDAYSVSSRLDVLERASMRARDFWESRRHWGCQS